MDEYDDDFLGDDQDDRDEQPAPQPRQQSEDKNLRQLRQKAKRADELERELDTLRRERAFDLAGIPDTPATKYFRRGYDGETTADAIKAAAIEAGFLDAPEPVEQIEDELDAQERMSSTSAGAKSAGSGRITPDTYTSWPLAQRRAFQAQHPDLTDRLKRGETVSQ